MDFEVRVVRMKIIIYLLPDFYIGRQEPAPQTRPSSLPLNLNHQKASPSKTLITLLPIPNHSTYLCGNPHN